MVDYVENIERLISVGWAQNEINLASKTVQTFSVVLNESFDDVFVFGLTSNSVPATITDCDGGSNTPVNDKATYRWQAASIGSSTRSITNATQTNPVVITTSADHGYYRFQKITITSVGGMTEINGRTFNVAPVTSTTFQLIGEDGTGHTAYTTGGSCFKTNQGPSTAQLKNMRIFQTNNGGTVNWWGYDSTCISNSRSHLVYDENLQTRVPETWIRRISNNVTLEMTFSGMTDASTQDPFQLFDTTVDVLFYPLPDLPT